ncbi:MAG: hypothetical protein RQ982_13500 [Gammaproteobacteria bacterium]|nr:hypothetical protein [Gammaproteobacteria bacterium]
MLEEHAKKLIAKLDNITDDIGLHQAPKTADHETLLAYADPLFQQLKSRHNITYFYIEPGAKSRSAESGGIEVVWQDRHYRAASVALLDTGGQVAEHCWYYET